MREGPVVGVVVCECLLEVGKVTWWKDQDRGGLENGVSGDIKCCEDGAAWIGSELRTYRIKKPVIKVMISGRWRQTFGGVAYHD